MSAEQLLPLVYQELRALAARKLRMRSRATPCKRRRWFTRRMCGWWMWIAPQWNSRGHFFAAAAEAMRRILVENARRKNAEKRGRDHKRLELGETELTAPQADEDWLLLDDAVECLSREDPAAAELAKLRLFAGLSVEEAADVLRLPRATGFRHWTYARAWPNARLSEGA